MPEGPDVKVLTDSLNKKYKKCIIKSIEFDKKNTKYEQQLENFIKLLPISIEEFKCHGKFLYWKLFNNQYLCISLMLHGHFIDSDTNSNNTKKTNNINYKIFKMNLTNKLTSINKFLQYCDKSTFGNFELCNEQELNNKLNNLGPDILNSSVYSNNDTTVNRGAEMNLCKNDFEIFYNNCKDKKIPIAKILLDQQILSGVGNYLRSEIFYVANVDPLKTTSTMSKKELQDLFYHIKNVANIFYVIPNDKYNLLISRKNSNEKNPNEHNSNDYLAPKLIKIDNSKFNRLELLYMYKKRTYLVYEQQDTFLNETVSITNLNSRKIYFVK